MANYFEMTRDELTAEKAALEENYKKFQAMGLKLNMARGKPGPHQMDLAMGLLQMTDYTTDAGTDARNYGDLEGLHEARELFGDVMGVKPEEVFVGGNSSLQIMYNLISMGYCFGFPESPCPWSQVEKRKFLCPVPGYDRHFKLTQSFGFELITIPMTPTGPDMDAVEEAIKDPAVKGIWGVPKYSNPEGIIYSKDTIIRMASMKPAAPDFTIMWDNAYCVHEFEGDYVEFPDILHQCKKYGNYDMVYEFASTSKITFPSDGVACMATSEANLEDFEKWIGIQTISYDKVNQQRHVLYLQNHAHTLKLMKKHAAFMAPKFEAVLSTLDREIAPLEIASWSNPKGGYFISLYVMPGCAKRVAQLCKDCGLTLTGAGSAYPYHKDPDDAHLRIAPTYPSLDEVETASDLLCVCVRLAAVEKLLAEKA